MSENEIREGTSTDITPEQHSETGDTNRLFTVPEVPQTTLINHTLLRNSNAGVIEAMGKAPGVCFLIYIPQFLYDHTSRPSLRSALFYFVCVDGVS